MHPELKKLLALLDNVIAAGEKATPRPWHVDTAHGVMDVDGVPVCYPMGDTIREANDANAIALFANLSPLMAQTLKDSIKALESVRDNWIGFPSTSNQHAGLDIQTICEQWEEKE